MKGMDTAVVIEDDPDIADLLDMYLRREGWKVVIAGDGEAGLCAVERFKADIVLLDIGLPGELDGFGVLQQLRTSGSVPVLMLTARDDEIDRVLGLELGADDYVVKPFSPREVIARVKAILRRVSSTSANEPAETMKLGALEIDTARREARISDTPVHLTAREFELAAYLMANRGLALSRQQLLNAVWGPDWYGDERTIDVHVRQLRRKLGEDLPLATVWGVGYRLD